MNFNLCYNYLEYMENLRIGDTVTHTEKSGQIGSNRKCEILSFYDGTPFVRLLVVGLCCIAVHKDCIIEYVN